jgi:lipocalin
LPPSAIMILSSALILSLLVAAARAEGDAATQEKHRQLIRHRISPEENQGHRKLFELPNRLCWVPFASCEGDRCEDVSPLPAEDFDLDRFIEKSWFIQKQQVNPYQSEEQLFCVVATYNLRDDGFLQVQNTANNGAVNGAPQISDTDSFFSDLCAEQVDGGELRVAPCVFQFAFPVVAGPYWVLAIGEDYSWAIISGGKPNEVREEVDGRTFCSTKEGSSFLDTNGSGLWLFTREKVASPEKIATMEKVLTDKGIYTGDLKPVQQSGCNYVGQPIKG